MLKKLKDFSQNSLIFLFLLIGEIFHPSSIQADFKFDPCDSCVCCQLKADAIQPDPKISYYTVHTEVGALTNVYLNYQGKTHGDGSAGHCDYRKWKHRPTIEISTDGPPSQEVPGMSFIEGDDFKIYNCGNAGPDQCCERTSQYQGTPTSTGTYTMYFTGRDIAEGKSASAARCIRSLTIDFTVDPESQSYPTDATVEPQAGLKSKKMINIVKWKAPKDKIPQYYHVKIFSQQKEGPLLEEKMITIKNNKKKIQKYMDRNAKKGNIYKIYAVYTKKYQFISKPVTAINKENK